MHDVYVTDSELLKPLVVLSLPIVLSQLLRSDTTSATRSGGATRVGGRVGTVVLVAARLPDDQQSSVE